jgi:GT2 family glycosyltransferase
MPDASVVIATRDRASFLRDCLASLAGQTARGQFEIVVVDNGSNDDTAEVVERAAAGGMPVRRVHVAEPNRGKARNAGIAEARADAVIFCDDDTVAPEGFVDAHLRARKAHPRAVVSGPIVNVPDSSSRPALGAQHFSRAFLCTCNAGVARADLLAVGGFDERYDLYGWEDTDLGVRLRRHGARRAWAWDAFLYHIKPPSVVTLEKRIALAREKGAMAARFVRKSPTLPVRLATGAYAANFARAAVLSAAPLRRWYERAARGRPSGLAADALVDAAYIDALRSGLRRTDG